MTADARILQRRIAPRQFLSWIVVAAFVLMAAWQGIALWERLYSVHADRLEGSTQQSPMEDYVVFYAAGRMVLDGNGSDLYDVQEIAAVEQKALGRPVGPSGELAYFNPPFVALLFAPFSLLEPGAFAAALFAGTIAMVLVAGHFLAKTLELSGWRLALFWLGFLTLKSTYWLLLQGQLSMFLVLGWLGVVVFIRRGEHRFAGYSLALVLVKPQMAILLALILLWRREIEVLRAFAWIAGGLVVVSILVSGPQALVSYPRFLIESTGFEGQGIRTSGMFGLNGLVSRLSGDPSPSNLWLGLLAVPVLAVVVDGWRRVRDLRGPEFVLVCGLTLGAALLTNAHLYFQDMVLTSLVIGFGALATRMSTNGFGIWPAIALVTWVLQLYTQRLDNELNLNLLTPLMLVMFMALYVQLRSLNRHSQVHAAYEQNPRTPSHAEIAAA